MSLSMLSLCCLFRRRHALAKRDKHCHEARRADNREKFSQTLFFIAACGFFRHG